MKHFSKLAIMTICLIITALFTSACGGSGSKTTSNDNSSLYFLLANNNSQEENNQQEENNNEDPAETSDITLTLADPLNADKIATADIFYKVESTAKSTDEEDQEISKATPTADDSTKFTVSLPDGVNISNVKIKAIITYDNEGECLDYFSSYDGISAENNIFTANFENSNGDFAKGTGTATDPYIISTPRHFANINKQDDQGNYLYLGKEGLYFKQDKDLDFTHLTGLKIVKAEDDKDITIETTNEKAPFYNNGEGNESIGKYKMESGNGDGEGKDPEMASLHVIPAMRIEPTEPTEDPTKNCFKGSYDGDKHTIDGLMFVNPQTPSISIFTIIATNKEPIKNLTIGENSIFFIDENNENYKQSLTISPILGSQDSKEVNYTIQNIENNAKIIVKNVEASHCNISGITTLLSNGILKNCTNNGNITIHNNKLDWSYVNGIANLLSDGFNMTPTDNTITNCTNNGNITITKTEVFDAEYSRIYVSGIAGEIQSHGNNIISECTNNGNITVSENKKMGLYCGGLISYLYYSNISNLRNTKNITVTNNTNSDIFAYGIATMLNTDGTTIDGATIINEGTITVTGNTEGYTIRHGELIGPESIIGPVFPPTLPTPLIP